MTDQHPHTTEEQSKVVVHQKPLQGWLLNLVVFSAAVAILMPAAATGYSAWVSSSSHSQSCARSDHLADAIHGILVLATTPQKGAVWDAARVQANDMFLTQATSLIDAARC